MDGRIEIVYGARRNTNRTACGFVPHVTVNGREITGSWQRQGLDHDQAVREALSIASEEADRYIGSWCITTRWDGQEGP